MIRIAVEGESAVAYGPFPFQFLSALHSLSGRKLWSGGNVKFEASPANVRSLKNVSVPLQWEDKTGTLAEIDKLEHLASQHHHVEKIEGSYQWVMEPFPHQQEAFALSLERPAYAYLLEMGLGKTASCLADLGELHLRGKLSGILVTAPKGVHRQWLNEQVPEHLDKRITVHKLIWKGKEIDLKQMNQKGLTFLSMNIDAISTKKGRKTAEQFLKLHSGRCAMVVDESHLIKNWKAIRTKAAWALGELATFKRIMTGTPIANNIMDAWAQFYFLDWKILGYRYMTAFRSRYCVMGGFEGRQIVGQKNVEEFYRLIAPHAYRKTKDECLNLPPKLYSVREYEMDDETKKHYKSMKKTFMTEFDNGRIIDAPHAAVAVLRLQQITCGYLPGDEEDPKRYQVISNGRIDVTLEAIEQIQSSVIIWCRFTADIERLQLALNEYRTDSAVTWYGGNKDSVNEANKNRFIKREADYFIANTAKSAGLDKLQGVCSTAIFYSNSYRALDRWQSEDRIRRIGMIGTANIIDIVATGSVDRGMMRNLRDKKSLSDLTFDEIRMAIDEEEAA